MRFMNFGNTSVSGIDFAAGDRQVALRAMHRVKLRPAAPVSSGWGVDVAGKDRRSVHASLTGKGDLRAAWWKLYSRVYVAVVPDADLERAMFSFHRVHHALTLHRLDFVMSVAETKLNITRDGVFAAVTRSFAREMRR